MRCCGIHLIAISHKILEIFIVEMSLKLTNLRLVKSPRGQGQWVNSCDIGLRCSVVSTVITQPWTFKFNTLISQIDPHCRYWRLSHWQHSITPMMIKQRVWWNIGIRFWEMLEFDGISIQSQECLVAIGQWVWRMLSYWLEWNNASH